MYGDQDRWQARYMRDRVRRIELAAAEACDILVSCCEGDQQFFATNARVRQSVVVPNAIDIGRFRGIEALRAPTRQALGLTDEVRLFLFTASKWGPNREAFDYLLEFARTHSEWLTAQRIHIAVVGNVTPKPVRGPGFTATGRVETAEPYFAAADAALNPVGTGAGTNVKVSEFIAARLPVVTTTFGARGFQIEDGRTGFLFQREELARVLGEVRRLFDDDPLRLRRVAEAAYTANASLIDMDTCVRPLVTALGAALRPPGAAGRGIFTAARASSG
jgi:glycosyltransferase involved in cell wall biosynthesis